MTLARFPAHFKGGVSFRADLRVRVPDCTKFIEDNERHTQKTIGESSSLYRLQLLLYLGVFVFTSHGTTRLVVQPVVWSRDWLRARSYDCRLSRPPAIVQDRPRLVVQPPYDNIQSPAIFDSKQVLWTFLKTCLRLILIVRTSCPIFCDSLRFGCSTADRRGECDRLLNLTQWSSCGQPARFN